MDNSLGLFEDTIERKVYTLKQDIDTSENIYYDFSLKEKDSIYLREAWHVYDTSGFWIWVDSIRNIEILEGSRRVFYLKSKIK